MEHSTAIDIAAHGATLREATGTWTASKKERKPTLCTWLESLVKTNPMIRTYPSQKPKFNQQ